MRFFLAFAIFSSFAHAGVKEFNDRWKECKKADECIALKAPCGECVSVNSRYKKDAKLHFRQKAMTLKCDKKTKVVLKNTVCFYGKCSCHR